MAGRPDAHPDHAVRRHPGVRCSGAGRDAHADAERDAGARHGNARVGGREHRWATVGLYDITEDGRISACWLLPLDQQAFDAVWSSAEG